MRIQYEYLKVSYGCSRVGLRVARNEVWKFVVDCRSATVLEDSATVLSRPHYGKWRVSKIAYDCRWMTTFYQDCNDDWQRWNSCGCRPWTGPELFANKIILQLQQDRQKASNWIVKPMWGEVILMLVCVKMTYLDIPSHDRSRHMRKLQHPKRFRAQSH